MTEKFDIVGEPLHVSISRAHIRHKGKHGNGVRQQ